MKLMELSKLIKISQGSLSDIENLKSDPSAKTIRGLYLYTDIDIIWMLTGKRERGTRPITKVRNPPKVITVSRTLVEFTIKRE